jgi:predicted dienelactone hydrolase
LAEQGAVLVGVNHPGSSFGDYDLQRNLDHGSRRNDLTTALDALLADTTIGPHIDSQRIYGAGFSFGGWTVLSIGGLRGNLEANHPHRLPGCRDIAQQGIDLTRLDAARWKRSYRDTRVKAVTAIDPALHQGLNATHASDMVADVLLIGLGQGADRLPDTDFSRPGATLISNLPNSRTEVM